MGGDIAAWCALRGFSVTLQDRELKYIEPALQRARELFEKRLREPAKIADAGGPADAPTSAGDGVAQADVVIEAIFENLEAKRELYAPLEPRHEARRASSPPTPRASCSSPSPSGWPTRAAGRPALLQSRGADAAGGGDPRRGHRPGGAADAPSPSPASWTSCPCPAAARPGFIVNRVLMPYLHEAMYAAQQGVPIAAIDEAAVAFGMPMGPIELADVVGLDVAAHVGEIIAAELGRPGAESRAPARAGGARQARPQERRGLLSVEGRQAGEARRRRRAGAARAASTA